MSQDITKENNFDVDVGDYGSISKDTIRFMKFLKLKADLEKGANYENARLLIPAQSKEQLEIEKQLVFINTIINATALDKSVSANVPKIKSAMNLYKNLVSKTGSHEPLQIAKRMAKFKLEDEDYTDDVNLAKAADNFAKFKRTAAKPIFDFDGLKLVVGETSHPTYERPPPPP
jgi:hypothetical protein